MSLRAKLLFSYATMFLLAVVMVAIGYGAARRWQKIAGELSRSYNQGVLAERVRWAIIELADTGMETIEGEPGAESKRVGLPQQIEKHLDSLRAASRLSTDFAVELDHVNGLAETYRELDLVISQISAEDGAGILRDDRDRWVARLEEITDDVDDAALAMEQYFRDRNRIALASADETRRWSVAVIGVVVALIALQLILMAVLLRRWVTRPVAELEAAADQIGAGHLQLRLPAHSEREWRKVADALHQMTRSLATLQQQLRVSERLSAIGEVAAYTAHNIRNPIASIRAMAQVALEDAKGNSSIESTLHDIIICVDKMEQWIAGLLNFARPLELNQTRTDLNLIVRAVCTLCSHTASAKGTAVRFIEHSVPIHVNADEALLEQALHAVVSNALDAVPASGQVSISMRTDEGSPFRRVHLFIHDNGPGIPSDMLPIVFKPFVTGKSGGSGLGLAQAKKIIELHLGEITIESTTVNGTTVIVDLPIAEG